MIGREESSEEGILRGGRRGGLCLPFLLGDNCSVALLRSETRGQCEGDEIAACFTLVAAASRQFQISIEF